jgi:hypothetical protein
VLPGRDRVVVGPGSVVVVVAFGGRDVVSGEFVSGEVFGTVAVGVLTRAGSDRGSGRTTR